MPDNEFVCPYCKRRVGCTPICEECAAKISSGQTFYAIIGEVKEKEVKDNAAV